ncbi:MAG: GNAT family N-acetyltransferase, partial [Chloroflexi bacterium]|nr:GNAT family N-acetyltransferase [Chloroflexota bacterium]
MEIRAATIADIERCKRLDGGYSTGHIWHMDESVRLDEVLVQLRRVRLPRAIETRDPRCDQDLFEVWQNSRCFLVADEMGVVVGYMSMLVRRDNWQGEIDHLVVHRPNRRRGVATRLLQAGEEWAQASALQGVMAVVQSKNDPAINLFP